MEKNMEIEVEIFRVSCWRVAGGDLASRLTRKTTRIAAWLKGVVQVPSLNPKTLTLQVGLKGREC